MIAANHVFYEAFSDASIERMEAVWSHDDGVACVHPGGPILSGWEVVRTSWEAILTNDQGLHVEAEVVGVVVEDPVAWITCLERVTVTGQGGSAQAVATNVFVLGARGWRMTLHHASGLAEARPLRAGTGTS